MCIQWRILGRGSWPACWGFLVNMSAIKLFIFLYSYVIICVFRVILLACGYMLYFCLRNCVEWEVLVVWCCNYATYVVSYDRNYVMHATCMAYLWSVCMHIHARTRTIVFYILDTSSSRSTLLDPFYKHYVFLDLPIWKGCVLVLPVCLIMYKSIFQKPPVCKKAFFGNPL